MKKIMLNFLQAKAKPRDFLFLSLLVMGLLWQPRFLHQELNLFEWGLYLPGIDAVNQGQVPFRDFFHLRGPFELYLPALIMKVFGFRADVLASYFYIGTVLTLIVAVMIAFELIEQRILLYSFILILVTRTFPRVVFTFWGGMRYVWGLLAIYALIRFLKSSRPGWLMTCGILAMIGALTSIEIGVLVVFVYMALLTLSKECRQQCWFFILGVLLVVLPYFTYLVDTELLFK